MSVAASSTPSGPRAPVGLTEATPSSSDTERATACTRSGLRTTISVGVEVPAGNASAISSWPSIDSTLEVKALAWVRSVLRLRRPSAITTRATTVPIHTGRGRRAIRSPIRRHRPCVVSTPWSPTCGMNGQNGTRPTITSSAGSSVSIDSIATAMPIAPTGPSPEVPLILASTSAISVMPTVEPDATIAGPAPASARRIASWRSAWRRSSSR